MPFDLSPSLQHRRRQKATAMTTVLELELFHISSHDATIYTLNHPDRPVPRPGWYYRVESIDAETAQIHGPFRSEYDAFDHARKEACSTGETLQ